MKNTNNIYFFKNFFLFLTFIGLTNCQMAPTKSIEQSAQVFEANTVLIDTRSSLFYNSFHIEGSLNLWWEDFLILKDPRKKIRQFDPNLPQVIERLAKIGISPDRTVILLNEKKEAIENKKWKWLLGYLGVSDVQLKSISELSKNSKGYINRFKDPEPAKPWPLLISPSFQSDLLRRKIPQCFMRWNEAYCL